MALLIAGILLSCWLLLPILTAAHVESFSARVESESIMLLRGHLALDEQAYPIMLRYLYGTRPGEIYLLAGLMKLAGTQSELAFRILILLSFILVVVGNIIFCRRFSKEGIITLAASAILTQGLCDTSFFFADNLTSAAFFVLALCLVTATAPLWQWLVVGILLGFAELVRIDVVVALPGLVLLLFLLDLKPKKIAEAIAGIATGAAAVLLMSFHITGISIAASFRTAAFMGNSTAPDFSHCLNALLNFFGIPGIFLFLLGLYRNLRTRSAKWNLAMSAWPVVFMIVVFRQATQVRHFYLLITPYVILHIATGIGYVRELLSSTQGLQRRAVQAAIVASAILFVAPLRVRVEDGPRTFTGRLWSPILWREWQRSVNDDFAELAGVTQNGNHSGSALIVTAHFQDDAYFHLRALHDGYVVVPSEAAEPACRFLIETLQKGSRTLVHLRTENPYFLIQDPWEYISAFQLDQEFHCLGHHIPDEAYLLWWGTHRKDMSLVYEGVLGKPSKELMVKFPPAGLPVPVARKDLYEVIEILPLSRESVLRIRSNAANRVANLTKGDKTTIDSFATFEKLTHADRDK